MKQKVNGEMIALARESRGLTQRQLAELVSLKQVKISRYESGLSHVSEEDLAAIARNLGRPESFFFWRESVLGDSCTYHRRRLKLSARELHRINAEVNILRIQASRLLQHTEIKSSYEFFRLDMNGIGGPEECARRIRDLWKLPPGPVKSVVGSIESAGGVVFRCAFGTDLVDGVSQWAQSEPGSPPVFFVSDKTPGDRARWTLAHEVGHVLMHHLPTDDPESEADRFAAEFLLPAGDVYSEIGNLTLQKASALKSYWRVSMAAIIRRAFTLGRMSKNQYEYLMKQMGALGYRRREPVPIPPEEPEVFRELVSVFRRASGQSMTDVGEYLGTHEDEFRDVCLKNLAGVRLVL